MANSLLTPVMVTRKALQVLHQKLNFIGTINRAYDPSFAQEGAKIGTALKIRLPNQYVIRNGANLSAQDTTETSTTLNVTAQKGVDLSFTSVDLTMSLDDFSARILEPAMAVLASNVESDALSMVKQVAQQVGTPGTTPTALLTYLQARAVLNKSLTPMDNQRSYNLNPDSNAAIVDALKGLFQDSSAIEQQYREGKMGRTAGGDWYENTLLNTITNGTNVTGVTVSGASQSGSNLLVGGTVANGQTFKAGQTFTIANVFRVHPETKALTSDLMKFVITADTTASGTTVSLPIYPALNSAATGVQNINAAPANAAALTFDGTASQTYGANLHYHKNAFTFATADLLMPQGVHFGAREVYDGISLRIVQQYTISNDQFPARVDVLYGYQPIRQDMACRIASI